MEHLKPIIKIVNEIKLKTSDLLLSGQKGDSKVYSLYEMMLSGTLQTDEAAAQHFYNSRSTHSSYKNLKSILRNRLVNTLFFIKKSKKLTPRANSYIQCCKYITAAKILNAINARQVAVDLSIRVLKKSLHYEFTDLTIDACYMLCYHFAMRKGDRKMFDHYNDLLNKNYEARRIEFMANACYLEIMLPYIKDRSPKSDTHQQAKAAYQKLAPYLEEHNSPYLHYLTYYIESLQHLVVSDYLKTIEVCKKAIAFFEQKEYIYKTALKSFYHQLVLCYTQLQMYPEGKQMIERSNEMLIKGSYNWYVNLDLYITLAIHSKEYQEAYYIFNQGVNHRGFKKLEPWKKEKWQILQAYIYFLIETGYIRAIRDDANFSKFRMGKFLNSVPTFSKDKRGLNIPILVIQIVLMILRKDYAKAINRIEAIDKYRARYLRKDGNFRSNCFIKMLLQIPISGFHKAGIIRRTEKLYDQLKSEPLEIARQAKEIEIIPYEDMWQIILNAVGTTFYKPK